MGIFKNDKGNKENLLDAILDENIEKIKSILENNKKKILKLNENNKTGWSPLSLAIHKNNIEIVKILIKYALQHKDFNLQLNENDEDGSYPLIRAISNDNIEIVKLLLEFAKCHHIIVELNKKDKDGNYPLLKAISNNNFVMVVFLIRYAKKYKIILKLNEKNRKGNYPLLEAINNYNIEIYNLLIDYATQHQIILKLNGKNKDGNYPLLLSINSYNIEITKLLIVYANQYHIILKLNEKNKKGKYPLLEAINCNNAVMVLLLMEYAIQHQMILNLNEKNNDGKYPLLEAIYHKNTEIVQLLMEYANHHQIILELNEKDNNGRYPLLEAISSNNNEIGKLLIEYSYQHQITLELNERNEFGNYPLLKSIRYNNVEMVKLLIEYAIQHQIILEYDQNKIGNNSEIKVILEIYEKQNEIKDEKDYIEREQLASSLNESLRIGNETLEREIEKSRFESELLEREIERQRIESARIENKRIENERIESEIIENERLKREIERERIERERIERERIEVDSIIFNYLNNQKSKMNNNQNQSQNQNQNNNNNDDILHKSSTLVIATNNFDGQSYDHLDIKKDEFLIVTNWNCEEKGWVYGHRKDNEEEKGFFPEVFIKICKNGNREKSALIKEITPEYKIRFENKINQLRSLKEMNFINSDTIIEVDRDNLFHDAYYGIMNKSPQELKKRLRILYEGEEGRDAGGILRDFFYQISKVIGNPNYSLFKYSHNDSYELEINPVSSLVDPNCLHYFRFIGRIIGLAIFNKQYLSVTFSLLLYKRLLNIPLEFSDLEYVDPQLFKNLQQLKENDGAQYLYLTFSMDIEDSFGNHKTIELKRNGSNIDVTDSNKDEYINLVIKNKFNNTNDKEQLDALKLGFYEIIPKRINCLIDEIDLKFLISGINTIDVDDWEINTDYEGYKKDDITIINFWKCVRNFNNENRTKLLLFATGNSQVPVTGFKDLQGNGKIQHFKLKKIGTEKDLPKSHTCFNRIDLPPYTSFTIMKQKLLLAISEGMGGFSMK